ncbi:cubilin homolog [Haematobia irritans]|uniref:cubilin homolog n=1 Tax=Haematobia irritans TaxID=7368 RepID=UPI003F4FA65D
MSFLLCISCSFIFIFLLQINLISADYEAQPKIISKNGDLILEASNEQNISLRLSHGSSLLINNVDIMERIRQFYTPSNLDIDLDKPLDMPSMDEMGTMILKIREDIDRMNLRYSVLLNRTRTSRQQRSLRRLLGRLRRLGARISVIEENLVKDECAEATDPCKNGGTCYDLYKGYHCDCPEGWTGDTCEEDVDECYLLAGTDLGCQNNAVCTNTPGSYKCTCANGFTGTHCRLRNPVCHSEQSKEFCGHGICVPANNPQGFTCICDQGWTRNITAIKNSTATLACDIDIDECEGSRNPCHSECINLPGTFKCGPCPTGYTGNGKMCIDVDECATNNGGCSLQPKVRCINTEGSHFCGQCPPGWVGDGRMCNLVPSNSCDGEKICHPQAKCEYISNVATCTCPHGMFGHGFGPTGCHTNPISDSCENHMCKNNGTCLATGRGTSCLCPTGYSGALCETSDGCHPNPCQNGGTCRPLPNQAYKCSCSRGTTGKTCEILRSICGSIQKQSTGELTYPADGSTTYTSLERCAWIIRTQPMHILNVTFTTFDVEEDAECNHDWLQIHDGISLAAQLIGRFCGKSLPLGGTVLSSQNQLFFWFRSDNSTNRAGFHMTWHSQAEICGQTSEIPLGGEGVIKSPGYPGKMPINRECQWKLSAPYGYRFILRIYEVNTGSIANCKGDAMKIYDGDVLIKEFCQSSTPEPLKSSSNKVKIHFHTDEHGLDSSFQLHYEVESAIPHCGGIFTDASARIIGPSGESSVCLYLIQQPSNTQIRLDLEELNLLPRENCNMNTLEIFDGKTDQDSRLFIHCGGESGVANIEPVTSSSNFMLLRYTTKVAVEDSKIPFKVKYSRVCEFRYFGPDPGVISTSNYPKAYMEHLTCTYHIYGPAKTIVRANFTDIDIGYNGPDEDGVMDGAVSESSSNGSLTYFDVYLSDNSKQRYYKSTPMVLLSELNKMTIVFHAGANPLRSRGLRLEYSFEENSCGGVFTEAEGLFDKGFNEFRSTCTYVFEAPEGQNIALQFRLLKLLTTQSSGSIYAIIPGESDYLLSNLTYQKKLEETYPYNKIKLIVHPNVYVFQGNYKFVATNKDCVHSFSSLYGTIKSPNWPLPYGADMNCSWLISAPLGYKIELMVQNFTLEPYCTGDFLEIRNGKYPSAPLIGRYCSDQIPTRITSLTNNLLLTFTSDSSYQGNGFHMTWEQTETGCGGKLTSFKGSIHSPVWNSVYQTNLPTCDWLIQVAQGSSIVLNITSAVDEFEFCRNNDLKIYDGPSTSSPLLDFNCASLVSWKPLSLSSSTNKVLILYTPTGYSADREFILDYETQCTMVMDHIHGVIESPNFPEPYPELLNCKWDIIAGKKNQIKLAFSQFSLEADDMECQHDYVTILDMQDSDILQRHRICTQLPEPFTSQGNHLRLEFVSDYSNSRSGFRAEYTRLGCGEVLTDRVHFIVSPNYPHSTDLDCDWYIEVDPGDQVVFSVFSFEMDALQTDCSTDALIIKETKNSSNVLLQQCSSSQENTLTITSPSNRLYIHYRSSTMGNRKFFKGLYRTQAAKCGGMFSGNSGTISSPNFPQFYRQDVKCVWEIFAPKGYGITITTKDLELPTSSANCTDNYLKLSYLFKDNTRTVCLSNVNGTLPTKVINNLPINKVTLEFQNKASSSGGRFALDYAKQCGGMLVGDTGLIKANSGESCVWTFNGTEGTMITFNILQFDCYCTKDQQGKLQCNQNGLGVKVNNFDADLSSDTYTKFMCEDHQTDLMFEASKLDIYSKNINFHAKYSITQNSCGGDISSPRGSLASLNYPSTYPPNVECTWTLKALKGNNLQLRMEEMDIVESEGCNEDYLEIRTETNGKLLALYCGNDLPQESLSTSNSYWIRFRSSEGSSGKGFKLKWSYAHLNEFSNQSKGTIESPSPDMIRNDEESYAWRIFVKKGNFIKLDFEHYSEGLNLYDGYDDTALSVAIQSAPWIFISSTNVVYLKTDNEHIQQFSIKWTETDSKPLEKNITTDSTCNHNVTLRSRVSILVKSPNYPDGYEKNLHCEWIFKAENETHHIVFNLYEVKLEVMPGCSADYVQMFTSPDMVHWHGGQRFCNSSDMTRTPVHTVHGTPHLKFDFVTDQTFNRTGFKGIVSSRCGSNLTQSVGFIQGNKLMFETDCTWHIIVKPSKRILLQLDYPPLSADKLNECLEYALIYDGFDEHAPLIAPGKFCNPQNATQIKMNSTSNSLTIKYKLVVPRNLLPSRWNLTYREFSDCNEEFRLIPEASVVNITSPNYPNVPHPHTECEWRIVAPPGEIIKVEFVESFDMSGRFCKQEYIELFDGSTSLARNLGKFCRRPYVMRTTQNILYMHYLTDTIEPRNGFKARISIDKCGGSYNEMRNTITSSGYPILGSYPAYSVCDYAISLPSTSQIRLVFEDVHLPFNSHKLKENDYLEIIPLDEEKKTDQEQNESSPPIFVFGNATKSMQLRLDTNRAIVRFHTFTKNTQYRGFKLKFLASTGYCQQNVVGDSGVISMNFPKKSTFTTYCQWKITVPKGLRVRLEFLNMNDLQEQNVTTTPTFSLWNDETYLSQITTFDVNTFVPDQFIQSTDNKMSVKILVPPSDVQFKTIRARYTSNIESPCPSPINEENRAGLIDINDQQEVFNTNYNCHTKIKFNSGSTLVFNITTLEYWHVNQSRITHSVLVFRDGTITTSYRENLTNVLQPLNQEAGDYRLVQSQHEHIKRLTMTYRIHKCGGHSVVYTDKFTVQQPEVTDVNYGAIMCVWSLTKPPFLGGSASEYRLSGNFSFSDNCDREFVIIKERRWAADSVIKICKDNQEAFEGYTLKSHLTYIVYQAQNYGSGATKFSMVNRKTLQCGSESLVSFFQTVVQVDAAHYVNNIDCSWIFYTKPGNYLQVNFYNRFFIEHSANCTKDYLEIQYDEDGIWIPGPRYCGRELPLPYNATSQRLRLTFHTDGSVKGDGFTLNIRSHCTVVLNVTSEVQKVESPTPLGFGGRRLQCNYIFRSNDSTKLINVRTIHDLPNYVTCSHGFTVYKRNEEGVEQPDEKKCARDFEERAYKYLRLSYDSYSSTKYTIEYSLETCGGNITTSRTSIRPQKHESPQNGYADDMNCVWYVTAPADRSIAIEFKYFDTETDFDYVSIYSGRSIEAEKLVEKLTGDLSENPPMVLVDRNEAVINAISDISNTAKGFQAQVLFLPNCNERTFIAEDSSPLNLVRSFTLSPGGDQYICLYSLSAPQGYRIGVNVRKIQMNSNLVQCGNTNASCSSDSCNTLEIFDSMAVGQVPMGKFCQTTNSSLVSSYQDATVKLVAKQPGQVSFEIVLSLEKSYCGSNTQFNLNDKANMTLVFPLNNNTSYGPNIHCTWYLNSSTSLYFDFSYIDLQNASQITGKCLDYIQIKYKDYVDTICGRSSNHYFNLDEHVLNDYTNNTNVEIIFHSDANEGGKGFVLRVTRQEVGDRVFNQLSGSLTGQYGKSIGNNTIILPENYNLNFYINPGYFTLTENCNETKLLITDLKTNKTIFERCDRQGFSGYPVFTTTNAARISASTYYVHELTYWASDRKSPPGCGGVLLSKKGNIASPPYDNDRNYSECRWNITLPPPNRIDLIFNSFDMGSESNCHLDNVKFYDIMDDGTEKLLLTACGSIAPEPLISKSNRVAVVSKKSPNFDGTGWNLWFRPMDPRVAM